MIPKNKIRSFLSIGLSLLPPFRGKGRITLLLDHLLTDYGNPKSYLTVGILNGGHKVVCDLRAWGQKFAYYYRQWGKGEINILKRLYSGDIFLDVGSSLGLYVVCLGKLVRKYDSSIISIEPVPFNLKKQKENVRLNDLDDIVTFVEAGLGSQEARVKIMTDPNKADHNAIICNDGDFEIQITTLDSLVEERFWQRIGLMKIDVEGYEPMVIAGARNTIRRDRPIIFAEFNRERMFINGFTVDESWGFLTTELDYLCYIYNSSDKKLHLLEAPGMNEDLFFIPSETPLPDGLCA